MAIYFMFGKYSTEGVRGISGKRTSEAVNVVKKYGGEVKEIYCLLGEFDIVIIVEMPNMESLIKASIGLGRLTGISFTSSPALSVADLDKAAESL